MKKRLFCLFISLLMLFALPSCDKKNTVNRVLNKTAELEMADADITFTLWAKDSNSTVKAKRTVNVRMDKSDKNEELYCIATNYDLKTKKIFLDNTTVYVPTENNTGYTMSREDYFKNNQGMDELYHELVKGLSNDILAISSATKNEYGYTVLSAYPSKEYFQENFPQATKWIFTCIEEQMATTNATIDSCFLSVSVKGGYLNELYFFCDVTVDNDKYTVKTSVVMNNPGADVEVNLPFGRDSYEKK